MRNGWKGGLGWLGSVLLIVGLVAGCQLPPAKQEAGIEARGDTSAVSLLLRASKEVYAETLAPDGGKLTDRVVVREPLPRGSYTVIGVVPAVDARMSARLQITIQ